METPTDYVVLPTTKGWEAKLGEERLIRDASTEEIARRACIEHAMRKAKESR